MNRFDASALEVNLSLCLKTKNVNMSLSSGEDSVMGPLKMGMDELSNY
jgi:hypothetical protein